MKNVNRLLSMFSIVICLIIASPTVIADDDDDDSGDSRGISGTYIAQLDVGALGDPRGTEFLGFVLHRDGTVSYNSEHEFMDLESAGIGVWKRLRGGRIGLGVLTYRVGEGSACALFFGIAPPANCVLKLGATLDRKRGGRLVGELTLTFETVDGETLFILPPLGIKMERLSLRDFPGASP